MTDETPEPGRSAQRRMLDALPDVVASTATGAVDFAITGTPSAGVAAPLLATLVRLGADARSSRQQRGARVLETAAEQVGGLDRLADVATADEARLELTARVIEAAMRTTHERKIKALGRVLANGLDGHATVDESQIFTAALDAIEAPHIQILVVLRDNADAHGPDVPHRDRVELLSLTNQQIIERLPGHKDVLGALTQVLDGYNLIDPVSGGMTFGHWGGSDRWAISPFGRALLARLEEQA
jgi:hypothetical protein